MRMERVGQDAPVVVLLHILELVHEVLDHEPRVHATGQDALRRARVFEVRVVIQRPGDRHLHQRGVGPELQRLQQLDPVALARLVGDVVVPHHGAVVHEAMLHQQVHGHIAQVPRRRTIAARRLAGQAHDALIAPDQLLLLAFRPERGGHAMRPAMVADLMARGMHRRHAGRVAVDRVPRNEPGRRNALLVQQPQDALRRRNAEIAPADERGRGLPARDRGRGVVVVKGQADKQVGHGELLGRGRDLIYSRKEAYSFLKKRTKKPCPERSKGSMLRSEKSFCFFFFRKRRILLPSITLTPRAARGIVSSASRHPPPAPGRR